MRNYYIYTRCSTEEQRKGFSHDYQKHGIQTHPATGGKECLGIFSDTISGTTFDRKELEILYRMCNRNRGHVDMILVYRWDRFGRDTGAAFTEIRRFKDIGVEINCIERWINYNDTSWPVLLGVTFGIAQSESLKISDRTRDGMYQANLQGFFTGSAPPGYIRTINQEIRPDKNMLVPDPETKDYVLKCFTELLTGVTKISLFRKYGKALGISKSSFYEMFENNIYTGAIDLKAYKHHPATTIQGKHEPIIPLDLFNRVQQLISQSTGSNRGKSWYNKADTTEDLYFLKGILYSLDRKHLKTGYQVKKKSGRIYYYYRSNGGKNIATSIAHDIVHRAIGTLTSHLDQFHMDHARDIFMSMVDPFQEKIRVIGSRLTKIEKQLDRIKADYLNRTLPAADYTNIKNELTLQYSREEDMYLDLQAKVHRLDLTAEKFIQSINNLGERYLKSDNYGKRDILRAIFPEGISLDPVHRIVLTPKINHSVRTIYCNPDSYTLIKNENGDNFAAIPVGGPKPENFLTDYLLFTKLIAI